MIFVSLPVHENPRVIINQLKNFRQFMIDAIIVLHISKQASFLKEDLVSLLKINYIDNAIINPNSLDTSWGNIIKAHISNIKLIQSISINPDDKIIFHASNDMLIKPGLNNFLSTKLNLFHTRIYKCDGYWWPANIARNADKSFMHQLSYIGMNDNFIVGSQIEGSMYKLEILMEIIKIIENKNLLDNIDINYPREEIYFPSFAYGLGIKPDHVPYVYSEIHYLEMKFWAFSKKLDSFWWIPKKKKIKRIVRKKLINNKNFQINKQIVDDILKSKLREITIEDGGFAWQPYPQPCNLFGVKRINRDIDDPMRVYINSLN